MDKKSDKEKIARENILRKSKELGEEFENVKGYDFSKGIDWKKIIDSFETTGAQATNLGKAMKIIKEMLKNPTFIYLGYTSGMVSSGLRDIFRFLIQNKKVNVVVTTAGGIEEDIIKCLGDFKIGDFRESGAKLRDKGINRIGNIFVPNSRYVEFEEFFQPILEEIYENQKETGKIISVKELIWGLGKKIGKNEKGKESICYWAWKNKIPIYCPAVTDGALGDNIYFFKSKHPDFKIDVTEDVVEINNSTIGKKKTGLILLGCGVIKHHILNANMFRNGADYVVYINNSQEFDASDAGALPEEAVSWGKIKEDSERIKVFGDATILFPLIVANTFALEN